MNLKQDINYFELNLIKLCTNILSRLQAHLDNFLVIIKMSNPIKIVSNLKTEIIREPLIKFLNNDYYNQEALKDYRDFTHKLDTVRETSLQVVNPQLYEWTFTNL